MKKLKLLQFIDLFFTVVNFGLFLFALYRNQWNTALFTGMMTLVFITFIIRDFWWAKNEK